MSSAPRVKTKSLTFRGKLAAARARRTLQQGAWVCGSAAASRRLCQRRSSSAFRLGAVSARGRFLSVCIPFREKCTRKRRPTPRRAVSRSRVVDDVRPPRGTGGDGTGAERPRVSSGGHSRGAATDMRDGSSRGTSRTSGTSTSRRRRRRRGALEALEPGANLSSCKYESVREVTKKHGYEEVDDEYEHWDLNWTDLSVGEHRVSKMSPFQRVRSLPGMMEICRKAALSRHLKRMKSACPAGTYDFAPDAGAPQRDGSVPQALQGASGETS